MAIVPSGLDQQAPGAPVAGVGDAATAFGVARGVLRRDEAEESHQSYELSGSAEVVQPRDESQGGDGVDASEAALRGDGFGIGGLFAELVDALFEPA